MYMYTCIHVYMHACTCILAFQNAYIYHTSPRSAEDPRRKGRLQAARGLQPQGHGHPQGRRRRCRRRRGRVSSRGSRQNNSGLAPAIMAQGPPPTAKAPPLRRTARTSELAFFVAFSFSPAAWRGNGGQSECTLRECKRRVQAWSAAIAVRDRRGRGGAALFRRRDLPAVSMLTALVSWTVSDNKGTEVAHSRMTEVSQMRVTEVSPRRGTEVSDNHTDITTE